MDRNDVLEVLVVVAGVTFPVWWFRFLVGYALVDLHDYFQEGSLLWGLVHTNFWLVTIPLGSLVGILHKWWKEEGIYRRGLEEYRAWRRGKGPLWPQTPPF